jgi:hypothetical protein
MFAVLGVAGLFGVQQWAHREQVKQKAAAALRSALKAGQWLLHVGLCSPLPVSDVMQQSSVALRTASRSPPAYAIVCLCALRFCLSYLLCSEPNGAAIHQLRQALSFIRQ